MQQTFRDFLLRAQYSSFTKSFHPLLFLLAVTLLLGLTAKQAFADNIGEGTTTTGQTLLIRIDDPADTPEGARAHSPNEAVLVTGQVAISNLFTTTHVVYVVDVSSSTTTDGPSGLDCNGDGVAGNADDDLNQDTLNGSVLDCEISGVIALNQALIADQNISTSLVLFGGLAVAAAVHPTQTNQVFTQGNADVNENGLLDIEEVARALRTRGINQFVSKNVGGDTRFDAAMNRLQQVYDTVPPSQKTAFFLSDGNHLPGTFDRRTVMPIAQDGIIVNSYSVGPDGAGCGSDTDLQFIADQTGGVCTEVEDPTALRTALTNTQLSLINHIEISVESSTPVTVTPNATGRWSLNTTVCRIPGQTTSTVEATVVADDGTRVNADILFSCEPTAIDPADEPLPRPNNAHTIFLPVIVAEE